MDVVNDEKGELAMVDRVPRTFERRELKHHAEAIKGPIAKRLLPTGSTKKVDDEPLHSSDEAGRVTNVRPSIKWEARSIINAGAKA